MRGELPRSFWVADSGGLLLDAKSQTASLRPHARHEFHLIKPAAGLVEAEVKLGGAGGVGK